MFLVRVFTSHVYLKISYESDEKKLFYLFRGGQRKKSWTLIGYARKIIIVWLDEKNYDFNLSQLQWKIIV